MSTLTPRLAPVLALALLAGACTGDPCGTGRETGTTAATTEDAESLGMSSTSAGTGSGSGSESASEATSASEASSATTLETSAGSSTDPSETGGCGFVCADVGCGDIPGLDGVPRCLPTCDVWAQDCPAGEKCSAWADDGGASWNAKRCAPVGADAPGEPCTVEGSGTSGIDSCALGAMCFFVDAESHTGTCVALCGGTPDAPSCDAPGTACASTSDEVLNLCLPTCDPLIQGCPNGQVCVDIGEGFFCVGAADPPGGAMDPCETPSTCAAGLACLPKSVLPGCQGLYCCSPYCSLAAPNTCQSSCVPWYEPGQAPAGSEDIGVCAAP